MSVTPIPADLPRFPRIALKSVERGFRRVYIRAVRRLARRAPAPGPLALPTNPRILLIRHDRIGDAVVSTPVMTLLRERYPDARIDIILSRKNAAVAALLPGVDSAIVAGAFSLSLRRSLRSARYNVVINLLASDSASGALLTIASGASHRIGFAGELAPIYDFPVPRPTRPIHIVRETSLLLAPFGIEPLGEAPASENEYESLRLSTSDDARAPGRDGTPIRIVFCISARAAARRWPSNHITALASRLRADGADVTIAAEPADAGTQSEIADLAGARRLPVTLSLASFVESLRSFDLVVTPQTSTVHVASALRLPTVLLNTNFPPEGFWTPWGVPCRVLSSGPEVSSITVEDALSAVRDLSREILACQTKRSRQ